MRTMKKKTPLRDMNAARTSAAQRELKDIIIETGEYTGLFKVNGEGPYRSVATGGSVTLSLQPGKPHTISFEAGYFLFSADRNGAVTNVRNPVAAKAEGNRLILNTTTITIDPGMFGERGGKCEFKSYRFIDFGWISKEKRDFVVVPGVQHQFDSGANVGEVLGSDFPSSFFGFLVREDGSIWSASSAANGHKNVLYLNGGAVKITPPNPNLKYEVGVNCRPELGSHTPTAYKGTRNAPVLLGVLTQIYVPPQTVDGKTYREAKGYFCPEYGFDDSHDLQVGDALFQWQYVWEPATVP